MRSFFFFCSFFPAAGVKLVPRGLGGLGFIAMLFKMMVAGLLGGQFFVGGESPAEIGSLRWWIFGGISIFLVCFAGIMSGLTLGLMSLGLMDLEVLQRSGTDLEKKQASKIAYKVAHILLFLFFNLFLSFWLFCLSFLNNALVGVVGVLVANSCPQFLCMKLELA